jgi:hypothetical protein
LTKKMLALVLFLGTGCSIAVVAASSLARFEGGIGVIPVRLTGAGAAAISVPNVVRGANPGSVPWVIARLRVDVKSDGQISADGRGLLIAGSNLIGTNAGQSVRARLFCGPASTAHDSGLVPLDPAGDFEIMDTLVPQPPDPCTTPVLLILNASTTPGGVWLAAGIPEQSRRHREDREDR